MGFVSDKVMVITTVSLACGGGACRCVWVDVVLGGGSIDVWGWMWFVQGTL